MILSRSYLGHDDDRVRAGPGRQGGENLVEVGRARGQDHLGVGLGLRGRVGDIKGEI